MNLKSNTGTTWHGDEKIVLDLRGNGGGYLAAAISIADEFLSDGNMIVYTEGRQEGIQKVLQRDRGYLKAYRLWSLLMKVLPLQVKLLQAQFKITTEAQLLVVELLEKAWYRRKKISRRVGISLNDCTLLHPCWQVYSKTLRQRNSCL